MFSIHLTQLFDHTPKRCELFDKSFRRDQISNASLHKNAENFAIEACLNNLTLLVQQPDQMAVR